MECQTYTEKTLSAYRQVFNFPQYDQIDAGNNGPSTPSLAA